MINLFAGLYLKFGCKYFYSVLTFDKFTLCFNNTLVLQSVKYHTFLLYLTALSHLIYIILFEVRESPWW
jgi:hypothetical protein